MSKRVITLLSLLIVAGMLLAACAKAEAPAAKIKVCQITDTGGIDDKSFNATAWKGIEDAVAQLGIEGKYLESKEVADYEKNLNAFVEEKCRFPHRRCHQSHR